MIKKIIWYSVVTISILGIIAFSTGFYKAIRLTTGTNNGDLSSEQNSQSPNNNPTEKPANSLSLITLGDSVAKGTGDETNRGFAGNLKDLMNSKTSKDVMFENLGIDGLRSGGLLEEVQTGKLDAVIKTADFILLSIGGNDLRTLQNKDDTSKVKDVIEIQNQTISDLKEIISHIREVNKNATVIFVGLYNPNVKTGSYVDGELVRSWNFSTQQLIEADERAIFVSTYDLIKFNVDKYIAVDGLHPNSVGYQAISNRIIDSIESLIVNK